MKNVLLALALLLTTGLSAQGIEFGLKAGVATESLQEERFDLTRSGRAELGEAIAEGDYGFQFGALAAHPPLRPL